MKRTIRTTLFDGEQYDAGWPSSNLVEFMAWLNGLLDQIPAEHRHTAEIDLGSVSSYEDSHYATIKISWTRDETDSEEAAREANERFRREQKAAAQTAEELRLLAVLQAKYSSPKE